MKTKRVRPILVEIKGYVGQYPFLGLNDNKLSLYTNENPSNFNVMAQELILISLEDEKIEVGNEYLDDCGLIRKAVTSDEDYWKRRPDYKKVIARQSQISPEYISKFVEQYNQDCIEDLEIEMENKIAIDGHTVIGIEPKITNGFVTIVEKKAISYTEEEVINMLGLFGKHIMTHPDLDFGEEFEEAIIWFENNKKK